MWPTYNIGDTVVRVLPDTGYNCVGIVQDVIVQGFCGEPIGYVQVQITEGNSFYPVGCISTWYVNSIAPVPG